MCYLIAKKINDRGCIALQTNFGQDLKYLSDYLTSRTVGKGIQIVTINNILGYPEYKPYTEYSCAAEPPVRCGESHHSGLGEPPFVTYLACLGSNPYTSRMDLSFEGSMHSMFIL